MNIDRRNIDRKNRKNRRYLEIYISNNAREELKFSEKSERKCSKMRS